AAELNQAAALLIQLEEGDLQGQLRIRTLLEAALGEQPAGCAAAEHLKAALSRMDDLLLGQCSLDDATADLNRLLESAMDPDAALTPAPPPAVAPTEEVEAATAAPAAGRLRLPEDADMDLL